jgi:restriction endonuclease S subunit
MDYKVVCPDGYEMKKLGDICSIEKGYAFKSDEMKKKGIRIIKQSNIIDNQIKILNNDCFADENEKFNNYILKKNDIILCLVGGIDNKMAIFDDKEKMYLNQNMCKLSNFDNNDIEKYVFNYLNINLKNIFNENCKTSIQNSLSKDKLLNLEIPFPKDINKLKPQLDKLYKIHHQINLDTESIPEKEKTICEIIKKATEEGKKGVDYDEYKLGDVCEFQSGKYYTKDMTNTGEYPFYNASLNNPIGTHNNYCFDDKKYIIIFIGGNTNADTIGNVCICKGKIASTKPTVMIYNYKKSTYEYLYYYMKIIHQSIKKMAITTTGLGWLNLEKLNIIDIKVLTENKMKKLKLQELFDEVDKLKENLETNKNDYEKYMKELFKDFEEKDDDKDEEDANLKSSKDYFLPQKKSSTFSSEKPKKKVKQTKKQKSNESESDSDVSSGESEKEDVRPKKIIKSKQTKKVESSSEESDNSSDSSTDSEIEIKPKKKIIKKVK